MCFQKVRRQIEVARGHPQRHHNVLVNVDFKIITREPFNDLAEKHVTEIGIAPARSWTKSHLRIRQHRSDLRPLRWFKRLPVAVGSILAVPGPCGIAKPRTMGEQIANRDHIDRAKLIVHLRSSGTYRTALSSSDSLPRSRSC